MPATFSRVKIWVAEVLDYAALNAEFDNILNNLGPLGISSYAANLLQYQTVTSPIDGAGNPVLPNSLAGDIERLRYQIMQILGSDATYWYDAPVATLSGLATIVFGNSVPSTRIESISSDGYANILTPNGTTLSVILKGSTNNITYYINDVRYELTTDVTLTGLTAAVAANHTATFAEVLESGQSATRYLGEYETVMLLTSPGTAITSSTAQQAFKVVRGATTEYFTAYYLNDTSDGSLLERARRGCYFTELGLPSSRTTINTGDTITLQKLAWLFLTDAQLLTLTYNTPTWSFTAPTSPGIGDFWFDLGTTTWKSYSALGFQESGAVLIGQAITNSTACVAARSVEPYKVYSDTNKVDFQVDPASITLSLKSPNSSISVYGNTHVFGPKSGTWSVVNLEGGGALAASERYYLYVKETGDFILSIYGPNDRRGDMGGYYHPSHSWRCVGWTITNASLFVVQYLVVFSRTREMSFFSNDMIPVGDIVQYQFDNASAFNIPPGYALGNHVPVSKGFYKKLRDAFGGTVGATSFTATTNSGTPTLTVVSSIFDLHIGQSITGTNIPGGTTIAGFDGANVIMSANASAGTAGVTVTLTNATVSFYLPRFNDPSAWTAMTVNMGVNWANTTVLASYRREGAYLLGRVGVVLTGAISSAPGINLPTNFYLKRTDGLNPSGAILVGQGTAFDTSASSYYPLALQNNAGGSVTSASLSIRTVASPMATLLSTVPFTWAVGDEFSFYFAVEMITSFWQDKDLLPATPGHYKFIKVLR